jgi:hypothetical protein
MSSTPQKKYCEDCEEWGNHCEDDKDLCPIFRKFIKKDKWINKFYL